MEQSPSVSTPSTPGSSPPSDPSIMSASPSEHLEGTASPLSSPFSSSIDDIDELDASHKLRPIPSIEAHGNTSSDSESGRKKSNIPVYSSASDSESQLPSSRPRNLRRKMVDSPLTPSSPHSAKHKKAVRRKSRASDAASEKSHRSEFQFGSGYTSTPATGKIFRNLLILEESLRQQVIQQRTLRRKYLTFSTAMSSMIASISYYLYFGPSTGPLRVLLQLLLLMLVVTLLLYHLSGEYQKTIVLPRKFLSSTNKGLRQLNVRLVRTKSSFTNKTADAIREFGLFFCIVALKVFHTICPSMIQNPSSRLEAWLVSGQSRCQPRFGLNDVKLVLIPRSFNTDIREGWELYRDEFWIKEGIRRRKLLLDFTRIPKEKAVKKEKKERRKRKSTISEDLTLSEQNLKQLENIHSNA